MNDLFVLEGKEIRESSDIFNGVALESKVLVLDCQLSINEINIPAQISDLVFVSCTNDMDLTIHSENECMELRFEYQNFFKGVLVSGVYNRVMFNSSPIFGRVYYPDGFKPSEFDVISFLKDAKANRLEFFSLISTAIKCVGVANEFFIHGAAVRDDVTIISSVQNTVIVRQLNPTFRT